MAAARKSAAARVKAGAQDLVEMCAEHFPHGWRHVDEHQAAVACEHGEYTREGTFATGGLVAGPVDAVLSPGEQVLPGDAPEPETAPDETQQGEPA